MLMTGSRSVDNEESEVVAQWIKGTAQSRMDQLMTGIALWVMRIDQGVSGWIADCHG